MSGANIAVAPHREVRSALELHDAVAELGYPCVVKPPHGRGSSGVSVLDNAEALRSFLRTGPFSDQGRTYPWLVEAFQPGEQYRVDGVCRRRPRRVLPPLRSTSTRTSTSSAGATWAPSCFPSESEEAQTILELARAVLEDALPAFDGGFHLEVFLTPEGPVFSEVGAADRWRIHSGGGRTLLRVQPRRGVDSRPARNAFPPHLDAGQRGLAGQLNFSPVSGILAEAPEGFEHPDVVLSEIASPGRSFSVDDSHQRRVRSGGIPRRLGGVRPGHDLKASAAHGHNNEMGGL